ncbi:MAG: hypothetical protein ACK2U1_07720 [Anaerolineales bacterium]|jgi:hypothetical protein
MKKYREIAVIAPKQMLTAFSVLINSRPNQSLLASGASFDELQTSLGEKKPDVVLVYLVPGNGENFDKLDCVTITRIKTTWPETFSVIIVKYPSQLEMALENGADLALVDGVNAQRLLAAIEGKFQ